MTTLTPELRQQIEKAGDEPVRIEDPVTHSVYIILKAEVYEKMRTLMEVEVIDPSFFEYGEFIPLKK